LCAILVNTNKREAANNPDAGCHRIPPRITITAIVGAIFLVQPKESKPAQITQQRY